MMFKVPSFENLIYPITLAFKFSNIEEHYKSTLDQTYLKKFSGFYLILIIMIAFMGTISIQAKRSFNDNSTLAGYGQMISVLMILLGVIVEFLVNINKCLQIVRTVPLVIFSCIAGSIFNSTIEIAPTISIE